MNMNWKDKRLWVGILVVSSFLIGIYVLNLWKEDNNYNFLTTEYVSEGRQFKVLDMTHENFKNPSFWLNYPKEVKRREEFDIVLSYCGVGEPKISKDCSIKFTSNDFVIEKDNPFHIGGIYPLQQGWHDWHLILRNESTENASLEFYIEVDGLEVIKEKIFIEIITP